MADLDLSGNDLKYVNYSILFTKRDYEVTLQSEAQKLINYSTDGASFGALQIAEWFGKLAAGGVTRPALWKELNYPPPKDGFDPITDTKWYIPDEDKRYITFIYNVGARRPRTEDTYERDQVRALEDIASKI